LLNEKIKMFQLDECKIDQIALGTGGAAANVKDADAGTEGSSSEYVSVVAARLN